MHARLPSVPFNLYPRGLLEEGATYKCRKTDALLRSKRSLILATMNVRTFREVSRAKELAEAMRKHGVAVCGVHRRVHEDDKNGGGG